MTTDIEWSALTKEQKKQLRREARARATERERARRNPAPTVPQAAPQWTYSASVQLEATGYLTVYCEVGNHVPCPRPIRCTCPCHDRRSTDE